MLRSIAFENLINFKDRQCLEFQEGVNFLVGGNSTGKSSILELIRRCHSVNLSSSVTNLLDDRKPGYIISKYEGLSDVFDKNENFNTNTALLCSFQERLAGVISIYKCICFSSKDKRGLYIAASHYRKEESKKERMIRRFSLQHLTEDGIEDFIDGYFHVSQQDTNILKRDKKTRKKRTKGGDKNTPREGSELDFLTKVKEVLDQPRKGNVNGSLKRFLQKLQSSLTNMLGFFLNTTENSNETSEVLMEKLQSSFAHVFPARSIGPLQWINGNNVCKLDASKNYNNAHKRAEILWELLPPKPELQPRELHLWKLSPWSIISNLVRRPSLEYENVDESEISLFKKITYPLEYEFRKDTKERKIEVTHINDPGLSLRRFELAKAPEGIIEAKQATLVFSHKKFKTICYEDIDRGMHNQMIENLNNFVLKEIKGKTVIIVTHNPSLINRWALGRTHVCTRQKEQEMRDQEGRARFINRVRKVPGDYAAKYGVHHDMKKCLFSARVLLVEGNTELHILPALFEFIVSDNLNNKEEKRGCPTGHNNIKPLDVLKKLLIKDNQSEEEFADNLLRTFTSVQIVSAGSKSMFKKAVDFCHKVKVSVMVLEDHDEICDKREDGTLNSPEKLNAFKEEWRKKKKKKNKFFWEDGTIEDALRADCPLTIQTIIDSQHYINCTNQDWEKTHKSTLKNRINDGLEDDKYSELFNELFEQIEKNKSSEFSKILEFINDQDFV